MGNEKASVNITELEEKLNYKFKNKTYILTALTHSSYYNEHKSIGECNERLEFLGDSVLSLAAADYLYGNSEGDEGELTRLKAAVVCEAALCEYAKKIDLGKFLLLGKGEYNGGRTRSSTLADAMEAVLGAIYLDTGFKEAKTFITPFIEENVEQNRATKDYKTILQEVIQKNKGEKLTYEITGEEGPEHDKMFICQVLINSNRIGEGRGRSKKLAEQQAAKQVLSLMGIDT